MEDQIFEGRAPHISPEGILILAALETVMATLDDVLARVAAETTIEQSVGTLLDSLVTERDALKAQVVELQTELTAAGQDSTKVDAILSALDSNDSLLNASRRALTNAVTSTGGTDTNTSTVVGGQGSDTVSGGNGTDTVAGGADTSTGTVSGAQGGDTVVGGNADDSITGGNGSDTLAAGEPIETTAGFNADDSLTGGQGSDTVAGA